MLALPLSLCLLATVPQEDAALTTDGSRVLVDEGHAFVELSAPSKAHVVGQPFPIVVRFGLEREFQSGNLIQLFRKQLDLPVQLQANWLDGVEGRLSLVPDAEVAEGHHRFALGDDLSQARLAGERVIEGESFVVYEVTRWFQAEEAQALSLEPVELRYAFTSGFKQSFLGERSPTDRTDALVRSAPLELSIVPLSMADAPIGFSGAIGSFSLRAQLERNLEAGGRRLTWTLRISGEGNLQELDPPSVADFEGFNLLGCLSSYEAAPTPTRVFVYDLEPKASQPASLPAFSFIHYDPVAGDYRTLGIAEQPLPSLPQAEPGTAPTKAPRDAEPVSGRGNPSRINLLLLGAAIVMSAAALIVVLVVLLRARSKTAPGGDQTHAPEPVAEERRRALADFSGAPQGEVHELLARYTQYLARCLSTGADDLQAEGLAARLGREGIPAELAGRAQAALSALLAARYGRGESGAEGWAVPELVEELGAHWG